MLDLGNRTSIYQPEQVGLIFPEMPEFANTEEERQHRKEHLVAACRAFARAALPIGLAHGIRLRRDIAQGEVLLMEDVDLPQDTATLLYRNAVAAG